ncbi:hypothetical protein HPB48_020971 [Haemaphysalis longicornis]|uniref:Transposable element P transposase-like RNase H domain-containing protein n=1 Tax=Haemaphysalis longicornis TaxID=44386 RepID=A0A9J6FB40_HAELO|nr:hypothetical protein HPB48_020971 [Haemaphysalis longicornis]
MSCDLQHLIPTSESGALANSLLCFLLCGLHERFEIPVAYFFTKGCTGEQLAACIRHVVCKTQDVGLDVVRIITDNHKVNVVATSILCDGEARIQAPHPAGSSQPLLPLARAIVKDIRLQFLAKDLGGDQEVSSKYLERLYKMLRWSTKPVRLLTCKHLYPSNIERMGVRSAVQLLCGAVAAVLSYLRTQQAPHAI